MIQIFCSPLSAARQPGSSFKPYAYEQALVRQKLDTSISEEEIQRYYDENGKNFELKDNIVHARWFKLREQDPRVLKKVEQQWRSEKDEDRHDLEVFLA